MKEEIPEDWESSSDLLNTLHNEGEILTPFYDLHELCSNMGTSSPKRDPVIEDIREKGYPVSRTHFSPTGFRTDAPIEDIKEIIRSQ
jgi:tRNA (guanine26-N2/guanine27-N2)-dimethyltransferase